MKYRGSTSGAVMSWRAEVASQIRTKVVVAELLSMSVHVRSEVLMVAGLAV